MSKFPRHQRRGLIEADLLIRRGVKHLEYFRAIKGAVSLKLLYWLVESRVGVHFRAIKGAVSLKQTAPKDGSYIVIRISAPSKARSH